MKKRSGFSLMELMVAILIFGFMSAAMAAIYSTANRALFQNYRANFVKGNVTVAMRAVGNAMATATRIDAPAFGQKGSVLSIASNVDQLTGCYPIHPSITTLTVHYFCASGSDLWYYTATSAATAGACSCSPSNIVAAGTCGNALPYPGSCGSGGGGAWTQLISGSLYYPNNDIFSRRINEGVNDNMSVRMAVTGRWTPPVGGLQTTQRDVNFTLESVFSAALSKP